MANTSWTNSGNLVTSRIGWTSAGRTGDDPVVKLEATGSDVGIGTTVPNNKLTVIGNISATGNIWLSSGPVGSSSTAVSGGIAKVGTTLHLADPETLTQIAEADAVAADRMLIWDESASSWKYITIEDLQDEIDTTGGGSALAGIDDQTSSNDDQVTIKDGEVVINEDSDDLDFRVESNGDANALFVNGGTDKIGIGTATPNEKLTVVGDISASGDLHTTSNILVGAYVKHSGDTDTYIYFTDDDINIQAGGTNMVDFTQDTVSDITFNEAAQDLDVRIEGEADANLFFTDGSTSKVGIGTNNPNQKLTVVGNMSARGDVVATGMGSISGDLHVGDDLVVKGNNASINGINYAWPSSDGSNGYQLTTNGSGTLSWAAAGGSGGGEANEYSFKTVSVSSRDTSIPWRADVIADTTTDTFTLCAGPNIELISDSTTDTITISARDTSGSSSVSFGTDNQIPYMNAGGNDFEYSANFTWGHGSNELKVNGDIEIAEKIFHKDDSNTFLHFVGADDFRIVAGGKEYFSIDATTANEVCINEQGESFDFRVEGDTNANLLFVDGSADKIGIGTSAPSQLLTVAGNISAQSLLGTDIKIGEDDQTKIDFETANEIHLYANNANKATVHGTGINLLGHTNQLSAMGPVVFSGTSVLSGNTRSAGSITTTGEVKTTANVVASGGHTLNHVELGFAVSDESTNLTTGTAKLTFRMPFAMHLTAVRANVNTAPAGSTIIVDINEGGSTILTTKLSIDASEKTSTSAATAAVIGGAGPVLADDAEMTVDIDQIGSSTAGKGLKIWLIGHRI